MRYITGFSHNMFSNFVLELEHNGSSLGNEVLLAVRGTVGGKDTRSVVLMG